MDYIKLYDTFVEYCKNTLPEDRLKSRNKNDFRLGSKIYTETHHILPKALGGGDNDGNLVTMLPEEHLFAHKIRYKAFNNRVDFISVRCIINGLNNHERYGDIPNLLASKINSSYAWIKQNSFEFRTKFGWQTEDGKKRISEARMGTFPVKCVISGEIIGSVTKDHPNVISGMWVHHSRGNHSFINTITGEQIYCSITDPILATGDWKGVTGDMTGSNNPRYSGITDDEIFNFYKKVSIIIKDVYGINILPPKKFVFDMWNLTYPNRKMPNLCGGLKSGFRFNGTLQDNLFTPICEELNLVQEKFTKFTKNINKQEFLNAIN